MLSRTMSSSVVFSWYLRATGRMDAGVDGVTPPPATRSPVTCSPALETSIKTVRVASLVVLSLASAMSLIHCNIGCVVMCFDRNPYWCLYNVILFKTIFFQKTFDIVGKMLIGR